MTEQLVELVIVVRLRVPASTDVVRAERIVRDTLTSSPLLTGTVRSAAVISIENI
jgi:hypothetical protein